MIINYFAIIVFQPVNVKLNNLSNFTEKLCSFALKQTIFLVKINFQIFQENSAFHHRRNNIIWHSKVFTGLLVCHTSLDMAVDFALFLQGFFLRFMLEVV